MTDDFNGFQPTFVPPETTRFLDGLRSPIDVDLWDPEEYLLKAKRIAVDHYNSHLPTGLVDKLTIGDLFVVSAQKLYENWLVELALSVEGDNTRYVVAYNVDRLSAELNVYSLVSQIIVPDVVVPIRR